MFFSRRGSQSHPRSGQSQSSSSKTRKAPGSSKGRSADEKRPRRKGSRPPRSERAHEHVPPDSSADINNQDRNKTSVNDAASSPKTHTALPPSNQVNGYAQAHPITPAREIEEASDTTNNTDMVRSWVRHSSGLGEPPKDPKTPPTSTVSDSDQNAGSSSLQSTPRPRRQHEDRNSSHSAPSNIQRASSRSVSRSRPPIASPRSSGARSTARSSSRESLKQSRNYVLVNYLYQNAIQKAYLNPSDQSQGVILKVAKGEFECCPPALRQDPGGLYQAVTAMNVRCAMTIKTTLTATLLETILNAQLRFVPMSGGLRVQVLHSTEDLPRCQLHHFAAFLQKEQMLVVWEDDPERLMERADQIEQSLVRGVWDVGEDNPDGLEDLEDWDNDLVDGDDAEAEKPAKRRVQLLSSMATALTLGLAMVCVAVGWRKIAIEIATDGHWTRMGLAIMFPVQFFISLFFFHALVGNSCHMVGPIKQVTGNSKYYSGLPPTRRLRRNKDFMPHITIQIPVYLEGLEGVIRPTVLSIKGAISTYEMQGGTANIFVNDDGMQLLDAEQAQARREFYEEHQIGWVARPGHGTVSKPGQKPFRRRGKFKKASNMNCALNISVKVEEKMQRFEQSDERIHPKEYEVMYQQALAEVLQEMDGRFWAEGNIRMGDYILLIDSDTRIPKDCFMDAVTEMEQSPQVAVLQFASGVMRVSDSGFEAGMEWFTDLIYHAITHAVASGDAPPFVGHNAMLRWQALQHAASYYDSVDSYDKYWSEEHVSEDFAMALGLQSAGYIMRYASYTGGSFQEGVSLTVYDELARWEKYSYGCNEIIFHPLSKWLTRGPFTPLFKKFICCKPIPLSHKITILAYMGTYYALAAALLLVMVNYFLTGWEYGIYDKFYLDSFACYISVITVFTFLGNFSLAMVRFRLKKGDLLSNFLMNIKWIPMFTIYLGGVSLHLSQSILCHFFGIDMTWGATSKEVQDVVFGKEIVRILKQFKSTFVICSLFLAAITYFAVFSPWQWEIKHFASIFPFAMVLVSHLLLPLLLSPALMRMSW